MAVRQLWCRSALLPGGTPGAVQVAHGVTIDLAGDIIAAVTPNTEAAPAAERLDGLTVPGFANAHSHAFHRALRSRTHGGQGDFWTWRTQMYALAERLTPDTYRDLATAVFAEMVVAGFTCVGEFHYLHHASGGQRYADPNEMGWALIQAARAAGMRLTLLDTCYLAGGFDVALNDTQRRFADPSALAWADRVGQLAPSEMVRAGAALHSVRAVPATDIATVATYAREQHLPVHAHVSEQPLENSQTRQAHGRTPTALLADHGAVSERFTAIHGTHLEPGDQHLLGRAGASVCFCPTTERDLADGVGPSAALVEAGVSLCIGSDSHAVIDPFEEMRAVELNQRLITLRRGNHAVADLLAMGAANGYRSLGWTGGAIAPGMLADLCTLRRDSVRTAGCADDDLSAMVVYAAAPSDVTDVIVGGRAVVRDGRHLTLDVAAALQRSIRAIWEAR